jgi:NADPH-dependent glutamate synthase beta subunit-like oxidoreductase
VDDAVRFHAPNDLYKEDEPNNHATTDKYVVLGCGETAMDTIVYLQLPRHVAPDNITWIISNDVWMMVR